MQDVRANRKGFVAQTRGHQRSRESRGIVRFAFCIGLAVAVVAGPALAWEPDVSEDWAHWQGRYRDLVGEAERLRGTIERERELYADANRRTYRRGTKRHVHRAAGAKAAEALAKVEAQLATIEDEARRAGVSRGWLNQIEMELDDGARHPAVGAGPGDEGRNPLYRKSTEDEPSLDPNVESDVRNAGRNPLYLE
jgi:hypothetical protein